MNFQLRGRSEIRWSIFQSFWPSAFTVIAFLYFNRVKIAGASFFWTSSLWLHDFRTTSNYYFSFLIQLLNKSDIFLLLHLITFVWYFLILYNKTVSILVVKWCAMVKQVRWSRTWSGTDVASSSKSIFRVQIHTYAIETRENIVQISYFLRIVD